MIIKNRYTGTVLYNGDGSDLNGRNLCGSDLSHRNLRGSNLRGSDLSGSYLSGSNLRKCDLSGSNLSDCDLRGSILSGSNLEGCRFIRTIGDGNQIHTMQTTVWPVVIFLGQNTMAIGCEQHSIDDWRIFTDSKIARMDDNALSFWKNWKLVIFQYTELIRQSTKDQK